MGAVPDTVRHLPGAVRSQHPAYSFCAVGPRALEVTAGHTLAFGLGEGSPLARCYDLDADVLLLGVGHGNNTSLHLAETRSGAVGTVTRGAPVLVDGVRRWVTFEDFDIDADDFVAAGEAVTAAGLERTGPVGSGTARLLSQPALVDVSIHWFRVEPGLISRSAHRRVGPQPPPGTRRSGKAAADRRSWSTTTRACGAPARASAGTSSR